MPRLARDRRGAAVVEFAMVSPVIFLLLVGFLDVVYIGRGHMRVQSTASQVGQIISQCTTIGGTDQAQIDAFAQSALSPYSTNRLNWAVVVTGLQVDASNNPSVKWTMDTRNAAQKASPDFATAATALPTGLRLSTDEMVFRTEVFANIDSTFFSSANGLLAGRLGERATMSRARSSMIHVSRSPSAAKLTNINSTEPCL